MKINPITCIISIALSSLIAFAMFSWCRCSEQNLSLAIVTGISLCLTLGTSFSVSFEKSRTTANIKVLSGTFAFIQLIASIIFCCLSTFSAPLLIIISGLLLLIWLLVAYGIAKAKE